MHIIAWSTILKLCEIITMPLVNLNTSDHFIIEVVRNFDFLKEYGYHISDIYDYRGELGVIYKSRKVRRIIDIGWWEFFHFEIERTFIFTRRISIYDLYEYYHEGNLRVLINHNNYVNLIKRNADFVKKNLIPLISGKRWISSISHFV